MRTDLQLIEVHRREAGAPEPPDLSEVPLPPLPQGAAVATAVAQSPLVAVSGQGLGDSVADLRLLALFVTKWKLDPNATKRAFIKLLPARRRYVMAHFKTKGGPDPNTELQQFVDECSSSNVWATAMATRVGQSTWAPVNGAQARLRPPLTITPRRPTVLGAPGNASAIANAMSQRLHGIGSAPRPTGLRHTPVARPAGPSPVARGSLGAGGVVDQGELRLMGLFAAKWKLNPARTRAALNKVLPARRRHLITSFKAEAGRGDVNDQLDRFIHEVQVNGWEPGRNGSVGVKRPISAVNAASPFDPNKRIRAGVRPTLTSSQSAPPATRIPPTGPRLSARPLTVLARPGSPGRPTVRPPPNLPRPVTPRSTLPVNARPTSAHRPYRPASPGTLARPIRSAVSSFQASRYN